MEEKVKNLEAVKDISNVAGKYYSSFLLSIYIHVHIINVAFVDLHQLDGKIYITMGQLGTLQCIAQTQKWTYTARNCLQWFIPMIFKRKVCCWEKGKQ